MSKGAYRVTVETSPPGSIFDYEVVLWCGKRKVADTGTDTLWGARWWGRREARKDRASKRSYEFEVTL